CIFCTILISNCSNNSTGNDYDLNLNPFKKLAQEEECAKNKNKLYLIDTSLVFWDREGGCMDNMFAQTLFGSTPDDIKCIYHDSIAGPEYACNDSTYHEMFQTIITNLDNDNLGLTPEYTVVDIPF
ncbi:hypothetical protein ACFL6H_09965, partial [Candidatus Latescibacterota bacterium]